MPAGSQVSSCPLFAYVLSDPEQRVRGAFGRQQPPGRHGRADRQHGGQNELHSVLARRATRHPHEVNSTTNPLSNDAAKLL